MRRLFWFVFVLSLVGLFLFVLGLYFLYEAGEPESGFGFSVVGAALLGVGLVVGVFYVAYWRIKILRDAHEF
jgi:uncharacterized membrane protein